MHETWRWFGLDDPVSPGDAAQAGAGGIVSALHHIAVGEPWAREEIERHQSLVRRLTAHLPVPLEWQVVESLPVSEDIKRQDGAWRAHIDAFTTSLTHLADAGIKVVCYNFMPLLDWTRTDLAAPLANQARCMRFDVIDFAMFDLHLLQRPGAEAQLSREEIRAATQRFAQTGEQRKAALVRNIASGLPGGHAGMTLDEMRAQITLWSAIDHAALCRHQADFLEMVAPHADRLGLRLCCHPDDPPFDLLGLPRIMSREADYARMTGAVDLPANGITLCSGSLGARGDNDLPGMMRRLGGRVHFLHLRNVVRMDDALCGSFYESELLDGGVDMPALVAAVLEEEAARRAAGRADHSIPFRPDHGQEILDDPARAARPGYPAIGRLKSLAELRGVIAGLGHRTQPAQLRECTTHNEILTT